MSFKLKVLNDAEFDALPYKHAREALGASDPERGIAYVRNTGNEAVNSAVLDHEIDELLADVSPHEVEGIRYKKFKDFAANAAGPILTAVGTAFGGPAGGALGAFVGSKISGKAKKKNSGGALGSTFRTLGTLAGGNIGANFGSPGSTLGNFFGGSSANSNFIGPLQQGVQRGGTGNFLGNIFGGAGGSAGKIGGQSGFLNSLPKTIGNPLTQIANVGGNLNPLNNFQDNGSGQPFSFKNAASNPLSIFGGSGGGGGGSAAASGGGGGGGGGILSNLLGGGGGGGGGGILNLLGGAFGGNLLGSLFAPKPEAPDFSSVIDPLKARIQGNSPAFNLGFGEAQRVLNAPPGEVPEEVFGASERVIDEDLADNLTSLRNQFKSLNPTANVENNSAFVEQSQRLQRDASLAKQQERSRVSFAFTQQELGRRLETMQTTLNLDQAQTAQLIQLAQLEVSQISLEAGVSQQEAQEVKDLFGQFGTLLGQGGGGQAPEQQAPVQQASAQQSPTQAFGFPASDPSGPNPDNLSVFDRFQQSQRGTA